MYSKLSEKVDLYPIFSVGKGNFFYLQHVALSKSEITIMPLLLLLFDTVYNYKNLENLINFCPIPFGSLCKILKPSLANHLSSSSVGI